MNFPILYEFKGKVSKDATRTFWLDDFIYSLRKF